MKFIFKLEQGEFALRKSDGFYLAELVISLAGWMIIASLLVPYIIQVKKQTIAVEERSEAFRLLHESVQTVLIEEPESINHMVVKGETVYEIFQEGEREICIRYEDIFGEKKIFCAEIP